MNEVPYLTLMMMNSTMPKYNSGDGSETGSASTKKSVNMFEMMDRIQNGKGL